MNAKMIRYPGRKWIKHTALSEEMHLREFLPNTLLFTLKNFDQMIGQYPVLFIKPDLGMKGQGIMKVTHNDKENVYLIRTSEQTFKYRTKKHAVIKLKHLIGDQKYLIQEGIDLIQMKGNPIDFRALLHLKPDGNWRFFGIMGKVAAPNRFVTNHSSGGRAIMLHQALGLSKEESTEWYKRLKQVSTDIAVAMKKHFPKIMELGLDIAIDANNKIWLIEANTKPQYQLFKYHSNPRLYGKIASSVRGIRSTIA